LPSGERDFVGSGIEAEQLAHRSVPCGVDFTRDLSVLRALVFPSPRVQGAFLGAAAFTTRRTPHSFKTFFEPAPK
jgi:hypothetical protein